MTTSKERDIRALLQKYPDERCQPTPATDQTFLSNNPSAETTVENLIQLQAAKTDGIIDLELVEQWQLGKGVFRLEPELEEMAA